MKRTFVQIRRKQQRVGTSFLRRMHLAYPLVACVAVMASPVVRAGTVLNNSYSELSLGTKSSVALTAADLAATRSLVVTLKMRNLPELQERVGAGEVIASSEMAAKYLPLDSDYQAVSKWLQSQGLTVHPEGSDGERIHVSGTIAQIRAVLSVTFGKVDVEGTTYISASTAPTVPDAVAPAIVTILGLQPEIRYHRGSAPTNTPPASPSAATPPAPSASDVAVSGGGATSFTPGFNYGPAYQIGDIEAAYKATNLNLSGAGQTIAIIIDDFPIQGDLNSFWSANGLGATAPSYAIRPVDNPPNTHGGGQVEATLDVSWAQGIAPGASIVVYQIPDLSQTSVSDAYSAIYTDITQNHKNINIVSISLGANEGLDSGGVTSDNTAMSKIASQGVTIFVSSGDGGSNPGQPYGNYSSSNYLAPETPASATNVIAVGGTTLHVQGSGSDTVPTNGETAWSLGTYYENGNVSVTLGSGGGVSGSGSGQGHSYTGNPRGSWQSYAGVPSGSTRCVPDVSLAGDPATGALLYFNGAAGEVGGTSWSAPTWAGFCARFNQARANSGSQPALGSSLVSQLYALAPTTALLRDITSGTNGAYNAGSGYDLVTGLGVFNFGILGHVLAAPFFTNEADLGSSFYFLFLPNGNYFGYYSDNGPGSPGYTFPLIYHEDLGYEYIFNANDSHHGIYMYDYKSKHFFYTSWDFPFPYLYDFSLKSVLYYYPNPDQTNYKYHYNTNNIRYFYQFIGNSGQTISQ